MLSQSRLRLNCLYVRLGVLALAALCPLADAQTHTQGFHYTIASQPDAYGLFSVTIENLSKLNITAVHAFRSCNGRSQGNGESSSVGADTMMQFYVHSKFMTLYDRGSIPPGHSLQLDMPALNSTCPKGVSVLFADGHGEGDDDVEYGWRQMIADRYTTYAELLRTRGIVEAMDGNAAEFPEKLLHMLDARRITLASRTQRDVPESEVRSRSNVLEALLHNLREPGRIPDDLKNRDSALKLLNEWMQPFKTNGYDRPMP